MDGLAPTVFESVFSTFVFEISNLDPLVSKQIVVLSQNINFTPIISDFYREPYRRVPN